VVHVLVEAEQDTDDDEDSGPADGSSACLVVGVSDGGGES